MMETFQNKRILVTGGTGSIGSLIVKELLPYDPYQIRVFSRDETKQFELRHDLRASEGKVTFLIGDIRDKERLSMAMENIDIVFHAAALKHVVSCETNPFEAVKTNVHGTQNIIDCAFANNVEKVVGISTDKATDPTNVMGCTKLLAEKMMLATHFYKGHKRTKFCFVRFGNVLGTRGSVVPLFIKQVKAGGPVTISDPAMTRFLMTMDEAVGLVLKSSTIMKGHEIFILKMPSVSVGDLAAAVIESLQARKDVDSNVAIETKVIGKLNGERQHEKLLTREESENALETDDMFIIIPKSGSGLPVRDYHDYAGVKDAAVGDYSSDNQEKMGVERIKEMIAEAGLL